MKHDSDDNIFAPGEPSIENNYDGIAQQMRAVEAYFKRALGCERIAMFMYDQDGYAEKYVEAAIEAGITVEDGDVITSYSRFKKLGWKKLGKFNDAVVWVKGPYAYCTPPHDGEFVPPAMYVGERA